MSHDNGLAQSADKQILFTRLGLKEPTHKLLLSEAQVVRDSMSVNPANLTDQSRGNPNVQAPYKWDEISETAKHMHILLIVNSARAETRPYYHIGQYSTSVNEENWVARWYLWHSFRYRDNRDTKSRSRSTVDLSSQGHAGGINPPNTMFYDPARENWR